MTPRRIDVSQLPAEAVALIDALGPDEHLVITRDDVPIAAVAALSAPEEASDDDGEVTVVATAMKLSSEARAALSAGLGPGYIVLDLHSAPDTADVLLVPPASPQLVESLREMYPKARVVVTEIEDRELGISYRGPVRRLLDAGAETYLTPTTIPRLARQLDHTITHRPQITGTRLRIDSGEG
ncbi:hypothetical protein [Actinokineospora globicatena]|uniref:Uncharacterized protein n=1 Tax=Actinokineospora globicatena TaxID=103729 RepID=A0A9W6VC14_9PSEU|nr:hypothetical protein [Actinokineospora globicatena]GLW93528.1 hypothetical protein Aglo03_43440 [Actinokineospora globicatena]